MAYIDTTWSETVHDNVLAKSKPSAKKKFKEKHPDIQIFTIVNIYDSKFERRQTTWECMIPSMENKSNVSHKHIMPQDRYLVIQKSTITAAK